MKTARESGKSLRCISRACFQSPARAAWVISTVSRGTILAMTEITPRPPTDMRGRVRLSSPESTLKSGPQARMTWVIWSREPEASLTPTRFLQSLARRARVSVSTLMAVRPAMLYRMMGRSAHSATARKCR